MSLLESLLGCKKIDVNHDEYAGNSVSGQTERASL